MSDASTATAATASPRHSQRSMASSDNLGDGRPEVAVTKLARSKSVIKRRKSKGVTPLGVGGEDDDEDAEDGMLLLNQPTSFDIRSFFPRVKSSPALHRSNTTGARATDTGVAKRRVRGHEELCLLLPKQSGKGGNGRKAWFMSAGLIGRDSGDNVIIATKDGSMDAVHAELTVDGDDYLLKDLNSSGGTYLCLSTTNRHHPQRDGYRLRTGDTIVLGFGAKLTIEELEVGPKLTRDLNLSEKHHSLQAKLDRRLTDQLALECSAARLCRQSTKVYSRMPSFSANGQKKIVRFEEVLDATKKDPEAEPTLPTVDGTDYPLGSRYKRKTRRPAEPVFKEHSPAVLKIAVTTPEYPNDSTLVSLPAKSEYTVGSSPWCDVQVVSDGIYAVHARIVFDGHFFVLQDLSFEDNPKRKTRVLLTRATRIGRGDWLLLGKCALTVVNVYRAFREHEPDLKEVIFKCQLLRTSKRKTRRRESFLPVGFKHAQPDPFVIGKGHTCGGQVLTATLTVEQFLFQLDHGQCSLTPRFAGINQGMYFLLGRNSMLHETKYKDDVIRYTSKALMLVEGCIFRIGSSEIEVTFVKLEDPAEAVTRMDEIRDNAQLLRTLPWLQQISFDRHSIENVARRAQRLDLEAGDSVYDDGDPASFLFVVIDGEIELLTPKKTHSRRSPTLSGSIGRQGSGSNVLDGKVSELVVENVAAGSYFGEASLLTGEQDYTESARAVTSCQLLVLSREDICGYFASYMDIIRPHLSYETHKDVLQKMRLCLPCCASISYQELRVIASKAERIDYQQDDWVLRNGVFTHKGKSRHGVLLHRYGTVDVVTPEGKPILVPMTPPPQESSADVTTAVTAAVVPEHGAEEHYGDDHPEPCPTDSTADGENKSTPSRSPSPSARSRSCEERQTWNIDSALMLLPSNPAPFQDLKARTGVQCFYIDIAAISHLLKESEVRSDTGRVLAVKKTAGSILSAPSSMLRRRSTNRRSSYRTQFKARHSQVFTTALRANNAEDENDNLLENVDLEDANDPSRKWRRKKRNKNLLEKTIVETQQNGELLNALVLYVLSGANRGDIHVVRNVATIGSIISGADIELNDRYVSPQQAVIEHREGRYWLYDTFSEWGTYVRLEENQSVQVYPGDVFLAGEVEFTCMGSFPDRKKTSLCCIQ